MKDLFERTEEEILNLIKEQSEIGDDLIVVGRFVNFNSKESFINIRNSNFVPLTYVGQGNEHIGKKLKIEIKEKHSYTLERGWYEFKIKLGDEKLRRYLNNPTLPTIDLSFEPKIFQPKEKDFVYKLYNRKANQSLETDRGNIQSLKIIEREINRVKEAFIYELLQNADDYPLLNKKVDVKIYTTTNRFVFSHNGSPFKFNNVYALCNINDGDKQDDADKIGYKGIGFKSVFAYSDKVLVKSGKYIFKFDKNHPDFQREKPFQIIPIWVDNLSLLKELPITENVNIVIEAKQGNSQIEEWKELLNGIFSQESSTPVILFLRNIRNVFIDHSLVSQTTREWWIREYKLKLSEEIKLEIKRQFETNTGNIPEKLVGVDEIEIQFALKHLDYEIISLPEAILYNYLPTKVNLGLPFLVNSDFIPTGDRHYLFENEWNRYLMKEVGKIYFDWLNTLFTVKHKNTDQPIFKRDYMRLLPDISKNIQELKSKSSNNLFLLEAFKEGFDLALIGNGDIEPIAFIPTKYGSLESLSNILIDETGLAELLGDEFLQLTGISEKLIDSNVGEGVEKIKDLIKQNDVGVIYDKDRLKDDIQTKLQDWLKKPSNNFKFIQYINSSDVLKGLLKSEEIILSESLLLQKASALYFEVPKEITFLAVDKVNSEVLTLLTDSKIHLSLTEFEPVDFFKNNILSKQENINASLADETNLLNFWKFIFDNWTLFEADTAIKDSFKHFVILCKPKTENELSKKVISSAYLSNEFNSTNDIEIVVKDISPDEVFISDKYIDKKREVEKWRKIFKQAGAITDLQKVIEVLLPKLPIIEPAKHLEIAKQIFKFWKDPANKLTDTQIVLIKTNLNIKCVDKKFRKSTECIISDHYNNNQLIASWLPNLELANQVAQEYAPRTNQVAEWKKFFALIGCVELTDKQNVFDAKIDFIITVQDELREMHFELLKTITDLHKNKKENGLSFNFEKCLSHIKLQTNNDEWHLPNLIHLSNIYKPKLSLQNDDAINSTFHFLNEKYIPTEIQKYFLTDIGVNDGFYFKKIIPIIHIDKVQEHKFVSQLESIEEYSLRLQEIKRITKRDARGYSVRSYPDEKIRLNTYVTNHLLINYPQLLLIPKYSELFLKFVIKDKNIDTLSTDTEIKIWNNNVYKHPNYIVWLLQTQSELENQLAEFVNPTELFSFNLNNYIANKAELPKINYSTQIAENGKSLEELLGVQQMLKISHCIELLSRIENRISYGEIIQLQIVEILSGYSPTDDEKPKLFLLNQNLEWKAISELFISTDDNFQIEPTQNLHGDFYPIAESFGVQELSEENLVLKTSPKTPSVADEIGSFFEGKAKFIGFKIDHLNYEEVEAMIIEKINQIVFYEVTSISKVFPEVKPIFKTEIAFHFEVDENKIFYKGNWKTNSELKLYLHKHVLEEKIPEAWFENVINRWDERKIIETLIDMFGIVPEDWVLDNEEEEKPIEEKFENPFKDIKPDDETFIRGIIKGDFELNEKLDANTTAKIKTLMVIKGQYNAAEIIDEGRFLKAGADEIIVRSAQNGLLYLDVYHWGRLSESNVSLSIYTKSQIEIFKTQEDLIEHTKQQNKFGIVRMPDEYDVDDYNSLDNINDKGKWHYVFIVNENTKAAQNYKEVINLDEYNF
jgi:hypothetical protein